MYNWLWKKAEGRNFICHSTYSRHVTYMRYCMYGQIFHCFYARFNSVTYSLPTYIYTSIKIRLCVNSDLTNISYWMAANKLSLNKSKTEYMIIGSHQNLKKLNSDWVFGLWLVIRLLSELAHRYLIYTR
jgi:hypothetical protein